MNLPNYQEAKTRDERSYKRVNFELEAKIKKNLWLSNE